MNIKLELTVDEINVILNALAGRPYAEVAEVIDKIRSEGDRQLSESKKKEDDVICPI